MNEQELNQFLWKENKAELEQELTGKNYNAMNLDYIHDPIPKIPKSTFFKDSDFFINRSPRFSYVPAHTHSFIELNYIYHGGSIQTLDDQQFVLSEGMLVMMDTDVIQKIDYANQDDILINILVNHTGDISALLKGINDNNVTSYQLLRNSLQPDFNHDNFIIFDLNKNIAIKELMKSIIALGIENDTRKNNSIPQLFNILLTGLDSCISFKNLKFINIKNDDLLPILNYINKNYKTVTLNELSQKFRYNSNYISNKIKKSTGKTFKQLIELQRLTVAENLMIKTDLSVSEIAELVGYKNFSSLYRLFQTHLNMSPKSYKEKVSPQKH